MSCMKERSDIPGQDTKHVSLIPTVSWGGNPPLYVLLLNPAFHNHWRLSGPVRAMLTWPNSMEKMSRERRGMLTLATKEETSGLPAIPGYSKARSAEGL